MLVVERMAWFGRFSLASLRSFRPADQSIPQSVRLLSPIPNEVGMSYQDKTLTCRDCGQEFVWTAGEQEYYAQKGFANEPRRCPDCRRARKSQQGGGGYASGGGYGGGGGYGRDRY